MARNYVQEGNHLTVTAPAALSSGDPVLIGDALFGVAMGDAESGAQVVIATEGVWTLPKPSAEVVPVGAVLYFDAEEGEITTDDADGDNLAVGVAVSAAGNPSSAVNVKLTSRVQTVVEGA